MKSKVIEYENMSNMNLTEKVKEWLETFGIELTSRTN